MKGILKTELNISNAQLWCSCGHTVGIKKAGLACPDINWNSGKPKAWRFKEMHTHCYSQLFLFCMISWTSGLIKTFFEIKDDGDVIYRGWAAAGDMVLRWNSLFAKAQPSQLWRPDPLGVLRWNITGREQWQEAELWRGRCGHGLRGRGMSWTTPRLVPSSSSPEASPPQLSGCLMDGWWLENTGTQLPGESCCLLFLLPSRDHHPLSV